MRRGGGQGWSYGISGGETGWQQDGVSPYMRSEIDPGVLELSKLDI